MRAMAGYSRTPLVRKLGIGPRMRVAFVRDPRHYVGLLGPLPEDVTLLSRPGADMDFIHVFSRSVKDLEGRIESLRQRLAQDGMLWVSWPKGTSPLAGDLSGGEVRRIGLAAGLVDVKVCAVDEDWSGLKFVYRLKDRAKRSGRSRARSRS